MKHGADNLRKKLPDKMLQINFCRADFEKGCPFLHDSTAYTNNPATAPQQSRGEQRRSDMNSRLSSAEFRGVHENLEHISDTWAALWLLLNLTQARVTQLIYCRYQDIHEDTLILPAHGMFAPAKILLCPTARMIISRRRSRYPQDVFLFQSHSRRVQHTAKPVTVIAFNAALKKAARGVTGKRVSSKSALFPLPRTPLPAW